MLKSLRLSALGSLQRTALVVAASVMLFGQGAAFAAGNSHRPVCPGPAKQVRCSAHVVTDGKGKPVTTRLPSGYGPAQFHTAYNLPSTAANPATIGIVDAYDDPSIKADLDTYNSTYGLPAFPSCTSKVTTSCFSKVNQTGGTTYPSADSNWSMEIALDVETAHEICQNCKIVLVEANSNAYPDLMAAEDRARLLGATVITSSFSSVEFSGEDSLYDSYFNHPGIAYTVSSGDHGYGATYPASSPYVTAVGGTSLTLNSNNTRKTETAWSGAGSGCSYFEAKPVFQKDTGCTMRSVADVAADADPNTPAAIYNSQRYQGKSGWMMVGGTSLASPLIAGIYALNGGVPAGTQANTLPYSRLSYGSNVFDVISGSNGTCGNYLCQGAKGYDGPTGLGAPIGLSAF